MDADGDNGTSTAEAAPAIGGGTAALSPEVEAATVAPVAVATPPSDDDTAPARIEEGTGIAIDGDGLPINHRLRAERLAADGKDEDPGDFVSPDLIANTKDRLEREAEGEEIMRQEAEAANPPVSANMKLAALERIAKRQNIDISTATNNDERVALIEAARASGAARPANGEDR